MSDGGTEEGSSSSVINVLNDAEACKELNQEELLTRVRKMNEDLEATRIPLHDVPVALIVQEMTKENMATSWSRLCEGGGRPHDGRHIGRAVRSASSPASPAATASTLGILRLTCSTGDMEQQQLQRRALTWADQYPRSQYRGDFFKPPLFEDEPSESDDDESQQAPSTLLANDIGTKEDK